MKKTNKKKYVIVSERLHPTQINELSMFCVIIEEKKLDDVFSFIVNNGGRVISAIPACGIKKNEMIDVTSVYSADQYVIFSMCQKEIIDIVMINLCREFEFNKPNHGKAFAIDILGYMGAKGPFVE